jgi:hypothetical protein
LQSPVRRAAARSHVFRFDIAVPNSPAEMTPAFFYCNSESLEIPAEKGATAHATNSATDRAFELLPTHEVTREKEEGNAELKQASIPSIDELRRRRGRGRGHRALQ